MNSQTRTVQVGDSSVRVATSGDGPMVLMHPSWGRGGADFDPVLAALHRGGFATAAIDPRGVHSSDSSPATAGQSEMRTAAGMTLRECAEDVWAVADALELDRVHLVGHAFGNRVVRQAAALRPDRATTVSLVGAGGRIPGDDEARVAVAKCMDLALPDPERLDALQVGFFAPGNDPAVWLDGWYPVTAELQKTAFGPTGTDDWWQAGGVALLVIQGLQDRAAPIENGAVLLRERGGDVRLCNIDGAGHALLPEQPEAIAAALVDFLGGFRPQRP